MRAAPAPDAGWRGLYRAVVARMWAHRVPLNASGVAFFGTLAVYPAVGMALALVALLLEPSWIESEIEQAAPFLPQASVSMLREQARVVVSDEGAAPALIAVFGLGGVLIAAQRAMKFLVNGLNDAAGVPESRGFLRRNLTVLALIGLAGLGALAAFGVVVSAPPLIERLGFPSGIETAVVWARWPTLALVTLAALVLLYRIGVDAAAGTRGAVAPGAAVAAVVWLIGTAGWTYYVNAFGRFGAAYGVLGGVMILQLWAWVTAFIVLMGAELNAALRSRRRTRGRGPAA